MNVTIISTESGSLKKIVQDGVHLLVIIIFNTANMCPISVVNRSTTTRINTTETLQLVYLLRTNLLDMNIKHEIKYKLFIKRGPLLHRLTVMDI